VWPVPVEASVWCLSLCKILHLFMDRLKMEFQFCVQGYYYHTWHQGFWTQILPFHSASPAPNWSVGKESHVRTPLHILCTNQDWSKNLFSKRILDFPC
jgi:hypothetical protein